MTPFAMHEMIQAYGFGDVDDELVYSLLNQALSEITDAHPWPWRERVTTLTFGGTNAYPSNASFTMGKPLAITNPTTGEKMQPMRSDEFQSAYASALTQTGDPFVYYFDAGVAKFYPIPTSSVTLTCRDLTTQAEVDSTSTEADVLLPAKRHWAAIFRTLGRLYAQDDDLQAANYYLNESDALLEKMRYDDFVQSKLDRPDFIAMSDADDDYYFT